jgi:hypothetical protein
MPAERTADTRSVGHFRRGTDGSNPVPSTGESTNHRFRRRFHGLEITKEKQRVSEALARVDAQREKLTGQLGELEATERVLARYIKGRQAKKAVSARTPTNDLPCFCAAIRAVTAIAGVVG